MRTTWALVALLLVPPVALAGIGDQIKSTPATPRTTENSAGSGTAARTPECDVLAATRSRSPLCIQRECIRR